MAVSTVHLWLVFIWLGKKKKKKSHSSFILAFRKIIEQATDISKYFLLESGLNLFKRQIKKRLVGPLKLILTLPVTIQSSLNWVTGSCTNWQRWFGYTKILLICPYCTSSEYSCKGHYVIAQLLGASVPPVSDVADVITWILSQIAWIEYLPMVAEARHSTTVSESVTTMFFIYIKA